MAADGAGHGQVGAVRDAGARRSGRRGVGRQDAARAEDSGDRLAVDGEQAEAGEAGRVNRRVTSRVVNSGWQCGRPGSQAPAIREGGRAMGEYAFGLQGIDWVGLAVTWVYLVGWLVVTRRTRK